MFLNKTPIKTAGVYKITSPDGHYYIGSSNNVYRRVGDHFRMLLKNNHDNVYMERVYKDCFNGRWIGELLEQTDDMNNLLVIEQKYLNEHFGKPMCMNLNPLAVKPPGFKNQKHSAETCAKISAELTGRKAFWVSNRLKGIPKSLEQRTKISNTLKGKPSPKKGVPLSLEQRAKISATLKGRPSPKKGKVYK